MPGHFYRSDGTRRDAIMLWCQHPNHVRPAPDEPPPRHCGVIPEGDDETLQRQIKEHCRRYGRKHKKWIVTRNINTEETSHLVQFGEDGPEPWWPKRLRL